MEEAIWQSGVAGLPLQPRHHGQSISAFFPVFQLEGAFNMTSDFNDTGEFHGVMITNMLEDSS
jgi:hypothetical protein